MGEGGEIAKGRREENTTSGESQTVIWSELVAAINLRVFLTFLKNVASPEIYSTPLSS